MVHRRTHLPPPRAGVRAAAALAALLPLPAGGETALCTAPGDQTLVASCADGTGGVFALWDDRRGGAVDLVVQRASASGALAPGWPEDGRPLRVAPADPSQARMVSDEQGGALVVWVEGAGTSADLRALRFGPDGTPTPSWPPEGVVVCAAPGPQHEPQLVSDGLGGALVVWSDYRASFEADLYAQHLDGLGRIPAGWPAAGHPVCRAVGRQEEPRLAADGRGGAVVAWRDGRPGGETDVYAHRILFATGPDPEWEPDGVAVCRAPSDQRAPQLVPDGQGGVLVAWEDARGVDFDVYVQHLGADGRIDVVWPAGGVAIGHGTGGAFDPVLASDGAGGALVAWWARRGAPDFDIRMARIDRRAQLDARWPTGGLVVCAAPGDQVEPVLVGDGAGNALVAWIDRRADAAGDLYASRVLGDGRPAPFWPPDGLGVCTAPGVQHSAALVPDGLGAAFTAWSDGRGDGLDVYLELPRLRLDAAAWPVDGAAVCATGADQVLGAAGSGTVAVADGRGGLLVAWLDARDAASTSADVWVQRLDTRGAPAPGWAAGGVAACRAPGDQHGLELAPDGEGGAYLAWCDARAAGTGLGLEVYAHHLNPDGEPAAGWPSDGRPLSQAPGDQMSPRLARDATGGVFVVWQDRRSGAFDLWVQRLAPDGTPAVGWPDGGRALIAAPGERTAPQVLPHPSGGTYVLWQERRAATGLDLFATAIGPQGALVFGWPADARPVATASGDQFAARLAPDVAGGALVLWQDGRDGRQDLYVQRLRADGPSFPGWQDGVPVHLQIGTARPQQAQVVSDGTGGCLVTWADARQGRSQVFVQRLASDGQRPPTWPEGGRTASNRTAPQVQPVAASDGQGGALLVWVDLRAGCDLYAQRLGSDGAVSVGWPAAGLPVCSAPGAQMQPRLATGADGGSFAIWADHRGADFDVYAAALLPERGVATDVAPPTRAAGLRAWPNPSAGAVRLWFDLPVATPVQVQVYDVAGRLRRDLRPRRLAPGPQVLVWDGLDQDGVALEAGVYFVCLRASGLVHTRKLVRSRR